MSQQQRRNDRKCCVAGCDGDHHALGYCRFHYRRAKRFGDPLSGPVPTGDNFGSRERFYRERVLTYDGDSCLIWPFSRGQKNGRAIWDKGDGSTSIVPRMVCEDVHGAPPSPDLEAAHSCGNGHLGCVTKSHLRWDTASGNQKDRVLHGTSNRGERNAHAKLSEEDVRKIRVLSGSMSQRGIARLFGVSNAAVADILHLRKWAWLE